MTDPDKSGRPPTLAERLEATRLEREEREKRMASIFGGAKSTVDKRHEVLNSLFSPVEKGAEATPLDDFVSKANTSREERSKQDAQLFDAERQARAQQQKDIAKQLFGREPKSPDKPVSPKRPKR